MAEAFAPMRSHQAATYCFEARAVRARAYGGESADLHGDAPRIDHLVDGGESAALVLGQAADFRQR
jgi:hypothetical protein